MGFAYAILRSISSKLGGVVALVCSVLVLIVLPLLHFSAIKGLTFYGPVKFLFWSHVATFLLLTAAGSWPIVAPFEFLSGCLSVLYFLFFPLLRLGRYLWDCALA